MKRLDFRLFLRSQYSILDGIDRKFRDQLGEVNNVRDRYLYRNLKSV